MFHSSRVLGAISRNLKVSNFAFFMHAARPTTCTRAFTAGVTDNADSSQFDRSLLEVLVCPLSKKPLRYDETSNELINDELGIAYPVLGGIPNMIPQDARVIRKESEDVKEPTTE
ncbi:hypothetical protein GJAV_G00247500 [Gymnothorax javanicus]|nr:hypothetical protein GJAV_G00247500 [Gymnothorax javanicus]